MTTNTKSQDAAEAFWIIATHSDFRICSSTSPIYIAAERALIDAIRDDYGVSLAYARKVRSLLANYGTDDTLTGTSPKCGIDSYVAYVRLNPRERF